ncbi:hypothetical protein C6P42_002712 [Pichia californica]|nr:hypothetical protein C6P42_002712 [[Candida] californica]
MFSKISQLSKTFADEINRINDEVNNGTAVNQGEQAQLADPELAKKIINTSTPDISEISKPENINDEAETQDLTSTQSLADGNTDSPAELDVMVKPSVDDKSRANNTFNTDKVNPQMSKIIDPKNLVPGTKIDATTLPPEIRSRLNKYFKYEKKYPQLYEAYKIEKKKTALINAFENMLKEQTPCSSIGELNAMRDYLNGINNQTKMVSSELTKITKDKKESDEKVISLNQKIKDLQKVLTSRNTEESNEIQRLKDEISALKDTSSQSSDLQDKYDLLLNENKELKNKIKELDVINPNNTEIDLLKSENEKIKQSLEETNIQNHELTEKSNKLNNDINDFKLLIDNEKLQHDEESQKLNDKVIELEKQIESSKKLNDLFKGKVETLSEELKEKTSSLLKATETSKKSASTLNQSNNSRTKKGKKKNQVVETPQNSKDTEILIPESESQLSNTESSLEVQLIELKHELEDLNSKYQDEITKSQDLKKILKSKDSEIEEVKDMLRNVGDSLVESQKANKSTNDLEKTLNDTKHELESKLNELEMLRLQNSNALTDYEKTKSSLSKKSEEYIKQIKTLEDSLNKKTSESESLIKKVDDISATNKTLESILSKMKYNEQKLQEQITTLTKEKTILQTELDTLKKSSAADNLNKTEYQNMKTQLARKERVLVEAENRIKFLQEEKSKINDSMIEMKVQNKEMSNQVISNQEVKDSLLKQNEKLKAEANENTLKINKLSLDNSKLVKKNEQLQDQFNEVKHVKLSSNDQVESFKKRVEELLMRNKEYENRIDVLQEELTQSRNMLQERTREMATMRKLVMDNEESQNLDRKELKSKFDRLLEEKEKSDNESLTTIRNKQREVEELKRKNSDFSVKLEELETNKSTLEAKIKSLLAEKSNNISVSNGNQREENKEVDQYNSKMINSLRESLNKTESRLKEVEDMNNKLRLVNQDSSDKLIRLNKKYKLLSVQYKRRMSESSAPSSRNNSIIAINEQINSNLLHPDTHNEESSQEVKDEIKEKSVYIKNVLMGFIEHKEQRQMLLPVIKMLLYMSDDDTKKLNDLLT